MTDDPTKRLPSEVDLRVYLDEKIDVLTGAIQSLSAEVQSLSADVQQLKVRFEAVEKTVIERSM